jgi:superfamily II DNA or RNA helicase
VTYFADHHGALRLDWGLVDDGKLRRAQLGACWALAGHDARSSEPAQIILPTGAGKTLVLCAAPFLLRARRVLVIAPGRLVRRQLIEQFATLRDLRAQGLLAADLAPPRVADASGHTTEADWERWRHVDVVVGTANSLSSGYPGVKRVPADLFDLVLFDEAQHLPARTWTAILQEAHARAALFSATPFRRDRKQLPGTPVFTYPLGQAMRDGIYAPIDFVPITVADGQDPDRALALAAAERLHSEEHQVAGSRLLVRAERVADAEALVTLYESVGVALGLVVGTSSPRTVSRTLEQVRRGELLGFVCVGALVEGFDFPALKIAAYHAPHRNLASTLQFIGRLARVTGARGELLAIPAMVEGETRDLYREDAAWRELLPQITDAALERERRVRHYLSDADVDGPVDLPPRALTPPRSARIYRLGDAVPDLDVHPTRVGPAEVILRFYDADSQLLALVTQRNHRPRWADTTVLDRPEFELHLATWVADQRILFVSTETLPALSDLLDLLGVRRHIRRLSPEDLTRLVEAADPGSYFSVGLRATAMRRAQGASYSTTAGSSVETALGRAEAEASVLGHFMARPRNGGRGTIGFSVAKSKLWEPEAAGSLLEFREWCVERATELARASSRLGLPRLGVSMGQTFEAFPETPIAAALDASLLTHAVPLAASGETVRASELDVGVEAAADDRLLVTLRRNGSLLWSGLQDVAGRFETVENPVNLRGVDPPTGELIEAELVWGDRPFTVWFADGSAVIGEYAVAARRDFGAIPDGVLVAHDWGTTPIQIEVGNSGVQAATAAFVSGRGALVLTDHGSGEIADLIGITRAEDRVHVDLLHCKAAGGASGQRLDDLYDVLGQAARSVRWTLSPSLFFSELARRLRERAACRVVGGDGTVAARELNELAEVSPDRVSFTIWAVQPGLSIGTVGGWTGGRGLLLAAYDWCDAEAVDFRVLASP